MNVSAVLNASKFLVTPSLFLPHATVATFDGIFIPVSQALIKANGGEPPDIKAVVLDKDNCFARQRENIIYEPYMVCFAICNSGL